MSPDYIDRFWGAEAAGYAWDESTAGQALDLALDRCNRTKDQFAAGSACECSPLAIGDNVVATVPIGVIGRFR